MFGTKEKKRKRLEQITVAVALAPSGVTQAGLAKALRVPRSTIARDMAALERLGVLLAEDKRGLLTFFKRRRE